MSWAIALVIRPFAMLLLAVMVLIPARLAVYRWMPEGKLKRVLLWRIGKQRDRSH